MKISIIAAVGKNRELGKDNKLLWQIPEDLKRFKKITAGHVVIMGRKTFESIGKPLSNRINIVITRDVNQFFEWVRQRNFYHTRVSPRRYRRGPLESEKITFASPHFQKINNELFVCESLELAIGLSKQILNSNEIFLIGGGQVYTQGINYADKLYLTLVDKTADADTFFPDYSKFSKKIFEEKHEKSGLKYSYVILTK